MKEYVSKEDLDETRQDFMDSVYNILSNEPDNFKANHIIDAYDLSVNNLPKIIKADIVSDSINRTIKIINHNLEGYLIDKVCEQIRELAEM